VFHNWPLKFKPGMADIDHSLSEMLQRATYKLRTSVLSKILHNRFFWLCLEGVCYLSAHPLLFFFY